MSEKKSTAKIQTIAHSFGAQAVEVSDTSVSIKFDASSLTVPGRQDSDGFDAFVEHIVDEAVSAGLIDETSQAAGIIKQIIARNASTGGLGKPLMESDLSKIGNDLFLYRDPEGLHHIDIDWDEARDAKLHPKIKSDAKNKIRDIAKLFGIQDVDVHETGLSMSFNIFGLKNDQFSGKQALALFVSKIIGAGMSHDLTPKGSLNPAVLASIRNDGFVPNGHIADGFALREGDNSGDYCIDIGWGLGKA